MNHDIETVGEHHDMFTIELRPTSKCNYNCYYCTDLHINSNPIIELNIDNIILLIERVKEHTSKRVCVFICGGEPTLYGELPELVNGVSRCMSSDDTIVIQSNLSRPISWLQKFSECIIKKHIVVLNGSYHNTQPGVAILDYIKKCMVIKSHGILGMISFGYNKQQDVYDDYVKACRVIGKQHCEIVPLINASVDQNPNAGNGTDNEIDHIMLPEVYTKVKQTGHFFEKHIRVITNGETNYTSRAEMWLNRTNNFHGSMCSIPLHKIYIDWDGSCYKCFNEQFSNITPIFNINDVDICTIDKYFENNKCMRCPFTTCFFDLEYEKDIKAVNRDTHVVIDKYYNTHEYRVNR
jgi:organic radical activating enzyme